MTVQNSMMRHAMVSMPLAVMFLTSWMHFTDVVVAVIVVNFKVEHQRALKKPFPSHFY